MQKNFAIVSVFILFVVLQGGDMYCAGRDTLAIKSPFPCLHGRLSDPAHDQESLHNIDSAGNKITMIPATIAVLQAFPSMKMK